jgi:hypothetical protein
MRIRSLILLAIAFVFMVGVVACGGEEKSEPAKKEEEIKAELTKEQTKAPEEEQKKEEAEPKAKAAQKYEDLPEEVKAKLPESEKQEIKEKLPEK